MIFFLTFLIQALTALVIVLTPFDCKRGRILYNFSGKFIYSNCNKSPKNYEVCNRMANELISSSIKTILLIYLSLLLGTGAPMYKILFTDHREFLLPVILPFIDPDTKHGFYINLAGQYISCFTGFVILPGVELANCVFKNSFTAYAAVVENDITEFGCQLEHITFSHKQTMQFRNMILKILDFGRFDFSLSLF